MKGLINEFYDAKFVKEVLKFETKLDLDKLTVAGHSMGGMTALKTAEIDERV